PSAKEPDVEGTFERFYEIASRRGIARMLAGLILMGRDFGAIMPATFRPAAERLHAGRVRRAQHRGSKIPPLEEALFAATFLVILVLGDSLFGDSVRRAIGPTSRDSGDRFRRWLIKLVERMSEW